MREILLTLLIGVIIGGIDVLPMVKMKLDKYSIASAFIYYLISPFIIFNVSIFNEIWWAKGGIITLILAIPIIILVAKEDKKSILPMSVSSVVLGTLIGLLGYFIL